MATDRKNQLESMMWWVSAWPFHYQIFAEVVGVGEKEAESIAISVFTKKLQTLKSIHRELNDD